MIGPGTEIESSHVKYPVVKEAFSRVDIEQTFDSQDSPIYWWDGDIFPKDFKNVGPNQRINKIPGMDYICYKSTFIHSMNQMRRLFPNFYKFFPLSFLLPHQFTDFQREHEKLQHALRKPVTWIVKPRSGCCGHGIKLIQHVYEIGRKAESIVIQRYVAPFLLDGFKFDFRFYVLVSNLSPYTVYIYREGLARFCTQKYEAPSPENLNDKFCHLTNTSINVENEHPTTDFTKLASEVLKQIQAVNPKKGENVWRKICNATALTMLAMWSPIVNSISNCGSSLDAIGTRYSYSSVGGIDKYNKFFHILGIDIMLNEFMSPIVLELNDRPSMVVTFDCEKELKTSLIVDTLRTISKDGSVINPQATNWEQILPADPSTPFADIVDEVCSQSCSVLRSAIPTKMPKSSMSSSMTTPLTFADTKQ